MDHEFHARRGMSDWPLPDRAFHLADAENWASIQREGLLSTDALIARAGLEGSEAAPFRTYRNRGMRLPSGALIRDQCPMPPSALVRCLDAELSPDAWYGLVNSKVFFWLDVDRLNRHRAACGARPQIIVAVDLPALLRRHGDRAFVTPFNVGNARRRAAKRGRRTFVPLSAWFDHRWESEAADGCAARARSHKPAEIAMEGSVPDLMDLIVEACPMAPHQFCDGGEADAAPLSS